LALHIALVPAFDTRGELSVNPIINTGETGIAALDPATGREHGRVAVKMYTETKSVCILV
jgi:hypothetical protein